MLSTKICFKIHVSPTDYSFLSHNISQHVPACGWDNSMLYTTILSTIKRAAFKHSWTSLNITDDIYCDKPHLFPNALPPRKQDNTNSQLRITALEKELIYCQMSIQLASCHSISIGLSPIIPLNLQRFLSMREYMQNFKNKRKEQTRQRYLLATSLGFSPALLVILLSAPTLISHCKHSMWPCPAAVKK